MLFSKTGVRRNCHWMVAARQKHARCSWLSGGARVESSGRPSGPEWSAVLAAFLHAVCWLRQLRSRDGQRVEPHAKELRLFW